jgi:hypothetical protein
VISSIQSTSGGSFVIQGDEFGGLSGKVTVGGKQASVGSWAPNQISGTWPETTPSGEVAVFTRDGKIYTHQYEQP